MEFTFEKLEVWRKARILVKDIYLLINEFPNFERYALCDQLRRASVSVPSNIAEGSGRPSIKERIHFIEIAYGSLMESYNQLLLASDLDYIKEEKVVALKPKFEEVAMMLSGLRRSLQNQLK
jgi:four helix bundle protein